MVGIASLHPPYGTSPLIAARARHHKTLKSPHHGTLHSGNGSPKRPGTPVSGLARAASDPNNRPQLRDWLHIRFGPGSAQLGPWKAEILGG